MARVEIMMFCKDVAFILVLGLIASSAWCTVKPVSLFTDNAVLQQGISAPVWGTAADGERVTVRFQGQEVSTTAKDGKWLVRLKPLKPGGPFTMTIAGSNTIELKNVLVGEVWFCSGQSNMQWPLRATTNAASAIAASTDPQMRLFTVPNIPVAAPVSEVQSNWVECKPETVPDFSAIGYYFGRDLRKALGVPVGLINTSWGGTRVEAWASLPALETLPDWSESVTAINDYGKDPNHPAVLYNGMIAPLIPYAMRGAIWYQGESNAGEAYRYEQRFTRMIQNWREDWGQGDFPVLFVQLAPFGPIANNPGDSAWAELRESQLLTSIHCPNTAMAVITDYGDSADIHPQAKEPVGARLALAAQATTYGKSVEFKGPRFESMTVKGDRAVLRFTDAPGGLEAKGGVLTGFAVAGEDRRFHNATARIVDDKVVVSSGSVTNPVAVRYAWADCPIANLFARGGLPATPFRTDNWPLATAPK